MLTKQGYHGVDVPAPLRSSEMIDLSSLAIIDFAVIKKASRPSGVLDKGAHNCKLSSFFYHYSFNGADGLLSAFFPRRHAENATLS